MIGKNILGYTVDEKIGSGAFGTVYRVSKSNVSGTYTRALKHITIPTKKQYVDVLNSMGGDCAKADNYFAEILKRITGEIQIISQLTEKGCQNIVRYYENDIVESPPPKTYDIFILMEYLTPFDDYVCNKELKVSDVIKLGKDILMALKSCHSMNIIHRDIKDDNIFVDDEGNYKLGDFGVSKILNDRSRAESMKGTPNYIAPEVYLGKEKYDNTVDLYSLGIVLYRLLNKLRFPFLPAYPNAYDSGDEEKAFEQRMSGRIPDYPANAQNILGEVVVKALRSRAERYNSAQEFMDALDDAANKLSRDELDTVVNVIFANNSTISEVSKPKSVLQDTIGGDVGESLNTTTDSDSPKNLFDTFGRDIEPSVPKVEHNVPSEPVMVEPVIKVEPAIKPEPQNIIPKQVTNDCKPKVDDFYLGTNNPLEPPEVPAVEKKSFNWLVYLAPVLIVFAYIITYYYGYGLFGDSTFYAMMALRVLLAIGFIISVFFVGRTIHNKKPAVNPNAVMTGITAYLRSIEILAAIKQIQNTYAEQVLSLVRNLNEHLKNESAFGVGDDSVITCENEIASLIDSIESNIDALRAESTAAAASENITACCQKIETKLKLRTELKKK